MNVFAKTLAIALLAETFVLAQAVGAPQTTAEETSRIVGDVRKPVLVKRVEPQCKWWKAQRSAVSTLQVTIWKDGRITEVKVVKGPETAYTDAASQALQEWEFRPATLNGQPVAVLVTFKVRGCWLSDLSYSIR